MNGNRKDSTESSYRSAYHWPPRSRCLCTSLFRFHALKRGFLFLSSWILSSVHRLLNFWVGIWADIWEGALFLPFVVDTPFRVELSVLPFWVLLSILSFWVSHPPSPLRWSLRDPSATWTGLGLRGWLIDLWVSQAVHVMNSGMMLYRFSYWIPYLHPLTPLPGYRVRVTYCRVTRSAEKAVGLWDDTGDVVWKDVLPYWVWNQHSLCS